MNLRVYIAPCGIGLGHITRAHPIGEELNRRGIETVYSTYLEGLEYAKRNLLPSYEAPPINFKVTNEGAIDFKKTAATSGFSLGIRMFLRQVTREIQFLKQFRPDVVLSDSRASSLLAARLLRIPVVLMLNQFRIDIIRRPTGRKMSPLDQLFFFIANLGWQFIRTTIQLVWGRSQLILIPDLPAPYTISLGNLAIPRRYNLKVKLIGPIIAQNPSVDRRMDLRRALGFETNRPLVYAAVSGPKIERKVLAQKLIHCFHEMTGEYQIVVSQGEPDGNRKPRRDNGVQLFDWVENQDNFIYSSDIVVSRAGHGTIMKALSFGKPMVLVPIPDHTEQYGNARRAASLHVAELIDQSSLNAETLNAKLNTVLHDEEYVRNSTQIRREISSTNGLVTACDFVVALARHS